MQKKKKGFWLFVSSLIPGAGEMYMGFKKQGISIMLLFFLILSLSSTTGLYFLIWFTPIIWFYSFYNVHNLKSLPDEEFYSLDDNYVLHLDEFLGDASKTLQKYRTIFAALLMIFGISMLWSGISDVFYWILPDNLANALANISYRIPQIIIGAFILISGIHLLHNKKEHCDDYEDYWRPFPPYQQHPYPEEQKAPQQETSEPQPIPEETSKNNTVS